MKLSPLHLALSAALLPLCAVAQESATQVTTLDPIVVTASRTAEPLSNVVGDVTVISNEQLQRETSPSLTNLFARTPGLQVYDSGGPQTVSGVYVRGASPAQTSVMVNGLRINNSLDGSIAWNTLNPAIFDHVEIVRGSASGLYGSSAMGGVINLVTTPTQDGPREMKFTANLGGGSHGTFRTNASISGATENVDYFLAGSYANSDGFNATNKDNIYSYNKDKDGYEQANLIGSLGYRWAPGQHIGVTFFNAYNKGDYDANEYPNGLYNTYQQQAYAITSTNQVTDWWTSTLRFGFVKNSYYTPPYTSISSYGPYTANEYKTRTNSRQYSWQNDFTVAEGQTISLVYEHTHDFLDSSSGVDKKSRHTNAAAALYKADFDRHHIQANLRRDKISGIDGHTTGGINYAFDLTPSLEIEAGFNTGFRAPTFLDMYSPFSFGYKGNPKLRPEKSRSMEVSLRYHTEDTNLSVTAFQTRYKDLINGYVCDEFFNCTAENVNKATIRGVTLEASQRLGNTTLTAGADFLNPKDKSKGDTHGNVLPRRAKQVYRASIQHGFERVSLGADYLFVGHRYDDAANTKAKRLGGYGLVNLRADYAASKNFHIQASVNNVFNKKYSPAYGYNGQGTNFFLNLSYQH